LQSCSYVSAFRDQDSDKEHTPPHLIVSVTRGPEVSKVRSLTEICDLRVSVELYVAPESLGWRSGVKPAPRLLECRRITKQEDWTGAFSQSARFRNLSFNWDIP
jgi:hypothetical protein